MAATVSEKFAAIKKYYELGLWTIDQVKMAVLKGKITATEFKSITGKTYTAD